MGSKGISNLYKGSDLVAENETVCSHDVFSDYSV